MQNMTKEQELKTVIVLAAACLVLFFIFKVKWFALGCLLLLIISLFGGKPSFLIAESWLSFAGFLGKVNTKIIIFLVYYLCLTPIAVIYRLFNKKQVQKFFGAEKKSYFKDVGKKYTKKDLRQLW